MDKSKQAMNCYTRMEVYNYKIDHRDITIHQSVNDETRYRVTEGNKDIGFLYFDEVDTDHECPVWQGTTVELDLIAAELGKFIEQSDR